MHILKYINYCFFKTCCCSVAKFYLTLCNPTDCSMPGFPVVHYLPAAAAAAKSLQSCRLCETPWTAAHQGPLSTGFSREEYWNGLPFPSPGHLPNPGIEPASPVSPAWAGRFFTTLRHLGSPWSRWPMGKLDECWKKSGNLSPLILLTTKKISIDLRRPGHRVGL